MKPLRFHPDVQRDIDEAIQYYSDISESLADGIWFEIEQALSAIQEMPTRFHPYNSNLRCCNLKRFPYHILYYEKRDRIRIQVIRHHKRKPSFGLHRKRD